MTGACGYACCQRPAAVTLDGFDLCRPHVPEHILLMAEDRARDALPYSGQLRPSRSLAAVQAVIDPQEAVA